MMQFAGSMGRSSLSGLSPTAGGGYANNDCEILSGLITEAIGMLVNNPTELGSGHFVTDTVQNIGCFSADEVPIPSHWPEDLMVDADLMGDEFGGFGGGPSSANPEQQRWLQVEAVRILDSACKNLRLGSDGQNIERADLVRLGRHELLKEKKLVKHELKRYDTLFKGEFGRLPTRWEKEPMRPLYTYYRKLKQLLGMWEGQRGGPAPQSIPENDEFVAEGGTPGVRQQASVAEATSALNQLDISARKTNNSYSRTGQASQGSTNLQVSASSASSAPAKPSDVSDVLMEKPAMAHEEQGNARGDETTKSQVVTADSFVENSIPELDARLVVLNTRKNSIRTTLQKYQERFIVEHRRKIRYHRDILPIEREYRTYKHIKEDIAKVEQALDKLGGGTGERKGGDSPGSDDNPF